MSSSLLEGSFARKATMTDMGFRPQALSPTVEFLTPRSCLEPDSVNLRMSFPTTPVAPCWLTVTQTIPIGGCPPGDGESNWGVDGVNVGSTWVSVGRSWGWKCGGVGEWGTSPQSPCVDLANASQRIVLSRQGYVSSSEASQ